jgi:hypothetical protein
MKLDWNIAQKEMNHWITFSERGVAEKRDDAIRLSKVMHDNQAMRYLIHSSSRYVKQIIGIFLEFYNDGDAGRATEKFNALIKQYNDSMGYEFRNNCHIGFFYQCLDKETIYTDIDHEPTQWLQKEYYTDTVVKALNNLYFDRYKKSYYAPENKKSAMAEVYRRMNAQSDLFIRADYGIWVAGYRETNDGIIKTYNDDHLTGLDDCVNNVAICHDLTMRLAQTIDYPFQFGWHESELFKEIMKLSYLTTFDMRPISMRGMNKFISKIRNAGHWRKAAAEVTREIVKNTKNVYGINDVLIRMSELRPNNLPAAEPYYQRDLRILTNYPWYYTQESERDKPKER